MSYKAVICNVMIASPNDVTREKLIARETLWNWNYLHSERTQIVLMPVEWETHSVPAMGDRPQGIINKQVVERCDLLIGVFWSRLGTPTGEAESGTVEEIAKHRAKGKPTMLYFSSAPIRIESVDDKQYARLKAFKQQCEAEGLIATYDDPGQFGELLRTHLVRQVDEDEYFAGMRSETAAITTADRTPDARPEIDLSQEARELLLEAVKDPHGSIMKVRTFGGLTVQTNNKNMVTAPNDGRCEALWEGAVDELLDHDLIADFGYKREVFRVTRRGYEVADLLKVGA